MSKSRKIGPGESWIQYKKMPEGNRYKVMEYWWEYDGDGGRTQRSKYMGTATEEEYQQWLVAKQSNE